MQIKKLKKKLLTAAAGVSASILALPAMASTGSGSGSLPWDTALQNVLDALQHGTAPKVVGLAICGAGFAAAAGDSGGMGKKLGQLAMAGGAVLAGSGPVITLLGGSGMLV